MCLPTLTPQNKEEEEEEEDLQNAHDQGLILSQC
jgi:hypothetical protein